LQDGNDFKINVVASLRLSLGYLYHALSGLNITSVLCEEGESGLNNIIQNFVTSDVRIMFIPKQVVENFQEVVVLPPHSHILVPHAITLAVKN
jgi:hypothetical protein